MDSIARTEPANERRVRFGVAKIDDMRENEAFMCEKLARQRGKFEFLKQSIPTSVN